MAGNANLRRQATVPWAIFVVQAPGLPYAMQVRTPAPTLSLINLLLRESLRACGKMIRLQTAADNLADINVRRVLCT